MKKLLVMSLAALGLALVPTKRADAWVNFKFSAGVNMQWQSGGNNLLWGLFRNGQPECGPGYGQGYGPGPFYAGQHNAPHYPPHHPPHDKMMDKGKEPGSRTDFEAPAPLQAPAQTPAAQTPAQQAYGAIANWYGATPYQTTSYNPYANYYQSYYPGYYGYYQAPSYWFGR